MALRNKYWMVMVKTIFDGSVQTFFTFLFNIIKARVFFQFLEKQKDIQVERLIER